MNDNTLPSLVPLLVGKFYFKWILKFGIYRKNASYENNLTEFENRWLEFKKNKNERGRDLKKEAPRDTCCVVSFTFS